MSKTPMKSSLRGLRKTPSPVVNTNNNRKSPVRMSAKAPAPSQGIPQRRPLSGSKLQNAQRNKLRGDLSPTNDHDEFLSHSQTAHFRNNEEGDRQLLQRSDRDDLKAVVDQQKKDLADLRRSPGTNFRGPVPAAGRSRSGAVPTPSNVVKSQHSSSDNVDFGAPPDHVSDTTEVEKYMGSQSLLYDFKKLVNQMDDSDRLIAHRYLEELLNPQHSMEFGSRRNGVSKVLSSQRMKPAASSSKVIQGDLTDFSYYSDSDLDENDELANHDVFIIAPGAGHCEGPSSSRTPTPNHTHKRTPTPDRVPCPSTVRPDDVIIRPVVNARAFGDIDGGLGIRRGFNSDDLSVCSSSNSSFTAVSSKGFAFEM